MEPNKEPQLQPPQIDPEVLKKVCSDRQIRIALARQSHWWFFNIYFGHYLQHPTAQFQKEMIALTERNLPETLVVMAFRGSAKSTICNLSYALWSVLGRQQKRFVILLSFNQVQARHHLTNIKRELENNELLASDFGPFLPSDDEWAASSLVLPRYGAKLLAASFDQNIRGLRFNQYRPDLIIADDVEDSTMVRTKEGRAKTFQWFTRDILPLGDQQTKIMVLGTLLHEDCLLMRLIESIKDGKRNGLYRSYPLLNERGEALWTGKFGSYESIEDLKRKIGDERAWQQEYLLHIMPDEAQAIRREWIQYYDKLPDKSIKDSFGYSKYTGVRIGVDLAISKREDADYTAMVIGWLFGDGPDTQIYILPEVINRRLSFPETVDLCKALNVSYKTKGGSRPTFVVEDVAYQKALPQQLENEGIWEVKTLRPGQDKRSRLALTSYLIKSGKILFPKQGAEELISQIVNFGVERHDDLADAFSTLVLSVIEDPPVVPRIFFI